MLLIVSLILLGYLIGSIPTAVWYARVFHKIDIREHGSKNAGATNSLRVLGKKAGITVLIIDILKGLLVIGIAKMFGINADNQFIVGFAAVIGHLLPIFAGFRGGKGIATSFGIIIALNPLGALICIIVFVAVLSASKYVSLGSLLGAFSFLIFNMIKNPDQYFFQILCFALFMLLVFTHRENIKRLLKGTENKYPPKSA